MSPGYAEHGNPILAIQHQLLAFDAQCWLGTLSSWQGSGKHVECLGWSLIGHVQAKHPTSSDYLQSYHSYESLSPRLTASVLQILGLRESFEIFLFPPYPPFPI